MALTSTDREVIEMARADGNIFTKYYFAGFEFQEWQKLYHHAAQSSIVIVGGVGCLSGDSRVYDPITGERERVKTLAKKGRQISVLSWTGSEFVTALALAPFKKGRAALYRVVLENGLEIKVTEEHRFLTPQGFLPLHSLACGSLIGVWPNWDQTIHEQCARRYSRKAEDWMVRCCFCCHQYDGQPLAAQDNDQARFPSQGGARKCNHLTWDKDARQGQEQSHSHRGLYTAPRTKNGLALRALRLLADEGYLLEPFCVGRALDLVHQLLERSCCNSIQEQPDGEFRPLWRQGDLAFSDESGQKVFFQTLEDRVDGVCSTKRCGLCPSARTPTANFCSAHTGHANTLLSGATNQIVCNCGSIYREHGGGLSKRSSRFQYARRPQTKSQTHCKGFPGNPWSDVTNSCEFSSVNAPYNTEIYQDYSTNVLWKQVSRIEPVGESDFYDLHVPIWNNYVAEGMVHHNSGKTIGTGISAATWAAMNSHFHFMDIAPTSWQASLMFDAVLQWAETGRYAGVFFAKNGVKRKPFPMFELINGSTLRFMTAQDDIARLRGWEGDWMHGDEFGFINTLQTTCAIMRTRLRGITPTGRARLGRLSITTTATDNPELWDRFDRHYADPANYLSFTVRTDQNPYLTARDIRLMQEDIPEELRAVEMDGARPTGRGLFFSTDVVKACEDESIVPLAEQAADAGVPGAVFEESPRLGVTKYALPPLPGREYLIVGDPGTGNPPKRNAAVIGVFDITGFPLSPGSRARMVAFAWVAGNGQYQPFELLFKQWWSAYRCTLSSALETTGAQKSLHEYAFTLGLDGEQMMIEGMDLSGNKKNEAIQALMQLFQRGLIEIPFVRGIRNQLVGFELPDTKLAQDIVSMLMCAAAWLRKWRIWGVDDSEPTELDESNPDDKWWLTPVQSSERTVRIPPLQGRRR